MTTGPESSGKTTLAVDLSKELNLPLVVEQSRSYLNACYAKDPSFHYSERDLLHIAKAQLAAEKDAVIEARNRKPDEIPLIVCDTDLLVIFIWSKVRFGHCKKKLFNLVAKSFEESRRHYLVCAPEMPWEPDPLRESPTERESLYRLYLEALQTFYLPYTSIKGNKNSRLEKTLLLLSSWQS